MRSSRRTPSPLFQVAAEVLGEVSDDASDVLQPADRLREGGPLGGDLPRHEGIDGFEGMAERLVEAKRRVRAEAAHHRGPRQGASWPMRSTPSLWSASTVAWGKRSAWTGRLATASTQRPGATVFSLP